MPGREDHLDMKENVAGTGGRIWRGIFVRSDNDDSELTGIGRSVTLTNWVYDGQVINGKLNGYGRMIFNYGDYYVGQFKDDFFENEGALYRKDGTVKEQGLWKGGICVEKK